METERKCSYCGKAEEITTVELSPWLPSYGADGSVERLTFAPHSVKRTNLNGFIRGLLVCNTCRKVINKSARTRNASIKLLRGKPLSSEQWGKFLESRKQ